MSTIKVELGSRSYDIHIEKGILDQIGERTASLGLKGKAAIVTNPTVGDIYGERAIKSLKTAGFDPFTITIPDGEEYKTLNELSTIYDGLIAHRMERSSPVIALGGGVIGDITGFAAATYQRGVPYIQVPTTLLSQVDSSVGGKTAVNHPKGKNLIGAFYQPKAVFIDPLTLKTLEAREVKAGLAEVIKYGVIRDRDFFGFLEENTGSLLKLEPSIEAAIARSCELKAEVVGEDETESGLRAILNYGHTFGHAIESLSGYGRYRHGEAVAIGMCLAAAFSRESGLCTEDTERRITELISSMGLPVTPPLIAPEDWIGSMRLDKKVAGGKMRFVLVRSLGDVIIKEAGEDELMAFFSGLK